jgi:hypothetical protein
MDTENTSDVPRFFWFGEETEIWAALTFEQALEASGYEFEEDTPRDEQWGELPADNKLRMVACDGDERPITGEPEWRPLTGWYEPALGLPQMICTGYN